MSPFRREDLTTSRVAALGLILATVVMTGVLRWQYAGFGSGEVRIDGNIIVEVDIAASDPTRERGLSGRESLGEDEGVLFLFAIPAQYTFWMKDMRFPIDALWIKDGAIVDISIDVQPPQPGQEIPVFFPAVPAEAVLEVPAGFARRHGLKLGMPVEIRIDRRGALR